MHLLAAQPGGFVDDDSVITRLEQTPADIVVLSAADTTLALLAAHCPQHRDNANYPSVRLAHLLHLRQHASVDLYLDEVLQYAKVIVVDLLGGEAYWPYGVERLKALAAQQEIHLVLFSGDSQEDLSLLQQSRAELAVCRTLWRYLREGGPGNAEGFYDYLGEVFFDLPAPARPPSVLPSVCVYHHAQALASPEHWQAEWRDGAPVVALVFYRAHWQAGNTRVFDTLCEHLQAQGLNPLPIALASLKDPVCTEALQHWCERYNAQLVLNTTAFSQAAIDAPHLESLVGDLPVLQVILSSGNSEAWEADAHGLQPRDIAMHVAMPEVDGRIITRALSFKGLSHRCPQTQTDVVHYVPHPERCAFVAELAARWCALRQKKPAQKRLALIMANYPSKEGRLGNGVGLDTPASVIQILHCLKDAGYRLDEPPADGDVLMQALKGGITNDPDSWHSRQAFQSLSMADYLAFFHQLPEANQHALIERWGAPEQDPMLRQQRFMIAGVRTQNVFIGIQPARGYQLDLAANYHDPDLLPPHYYLAFYAWLRQQFACDAILHVGKHGNLEWLPGKSVALSQHCWPDAIFGPTPQLYPFIVNDPGEGSQAKRRTQAVILDHLMPPLTRAENYGEVQDLERLVDEYYEALTLDYARAKRLRARILALIIEQNLHRDLGFDSPQNDEQEQALLNSTDAYLCELKESQIRDGLHIYGQSPEGRLARDTLLALARYPVGRGDGENDSLLRALSRDLALGLDFDPLQAEWQQAWTGPRPAALRDICDGPWRHVGDTRAIPTPTAWQIGAHSAELMIEKYLQEHGDYPTSVGLSVWGTATMRTGGDDIAQALALIGVKPRWASGSHRVTDFDILPMSLLDRPRIDVTLRVSGFFRDAFSNVIRLFDAAVQAVAELDEAPDLNPIRARIAHETQNLQAQGHSAQEARQQAGYRIFGAKPGAYGAGLQGLIDSKDWQSDEDLARAYRNWGAFAYGQKDYGREAQASFEQRLSNIQLVMHNQDNREHDLLDSDDYYQFQGGMSAAVRHYSGQQPSLYFGDHSNPQTPRVRSLEQEISRVVRARVSNPKWIDGVKRHGYKGAFEMAATVDYLFAYDATARVVRDDQYARVTEAYVGDPETRGFLQQHNPDALRDICERLLEAIARGLWAEPGDHQQQLEQQLLQIEQQLEG